MSIVNQLVAPWPHMFCSAQEALTDSHAPLMLIALSAHCCGVSGSFGVADAASSLASLSGSQILRSAHQQQQPTSLLMRSQQGAVSS
jgi:hypothetical protein